ncbi:MAG TPA: glycosyltransferase family 2 protein [Bacillota bacterium]|nr:glycosyltransferase family 2 protein [Bacillota bacterium]HOK69630.1 glycosyltransferase family 2 protein [Bacillota bacterium]HPP85203.1 glycosyltransferase family 2 protein [Bacillota bacterium]
MKLSLAMIVKNEEEKLARCLNSVKDHVDEIVVADTGSTDKTKEIARSFGAKIYDFAWCKDFSKARNFSIEKTTGDYVLVLDADQVLLQFDMQSVLKIMEGKKVLGLAEIINHYTQNGQKMAHRSFTGAVFPREARYVGAIHEQIDSSYPRVRLPISIFHDGYENRAEEKFKRNIEILENVLKTNKDPYLMYKLAQEYKGLNQPDKADRHFSSAYRTGDRSSAYFPNLVAEYLHNLVDLKLYAKVLELVKNEEKNYSDFPEFYFICGKFYTELVLSNPKQHIGYFPKIKESYEKCIAIGENPKYQGVVGMGTFMPMHNLAAFYEVTGDLASAKAYYKAAADLGFAPSQKRLQELMAAKR